MTAAATSVAIKDCCQAENIKGAIARDTWDSQEHRMERNTNRVLDLMAERGVKSTFFTLGWVADRCPRMMRRIAAGGRKRNCHGYGHDPVYDLDPETFRADLPRAKGVIESTSSGELTGYRAELLHHGLGHRRPARRRLQVRLVGVRDRRARPLCQARSCRSR